MRAAPEQISPLWRQHIVKPGEVETFHDHVDAISPPVFGEGAAQGEEQ